MEAAPVLVSSKVTSFGFAGSKHSIFSFRHFHKQVERKFCTRNSHTQTNLTTSKSHSNTSSSIPIFNLNQRCFPLFPLSTTYNGRFLYLPPLQCSYSNTEDTDIEDEDVLLETIEGFSLESMKKEFSQLTPFDLFKWSLVFAIVIATTKCVKLVLSPFFWMYFSMTWLFWPWFVAITLAIYGLYCLNKHLRREANVFDQIAIVTSSFTWLTLVPPAHFNGFLEGWPLVFFFVYHYFFFLNVSVRKRLYGDLYPRRHDPMWDISLPNWEKLLFCAGVFVGHFFAAFEGPELHLIPGGWSNLGIWVLIMMTVFMQYHSTLYLAKYSEKVVVPTAVVQFGPYRLVRHPIYASTILLFVTYCVALRAPLSALFLAVVCSLYYGHKAKLEEALMVESFGERYTEYASRVRYKLIPFVY